MTDEGILLPGGGRQFQIPVQQQEISLPQPDGSIRKLTVAFPAIMGENAKEAAQSLQLDTIAKLLLQVVVEVNALRLTLSPSPKKGNGPRAFHPPTGENNHRE